MSLRTAVKSPILLISSMCPNEKYKKEMSKEATVYAEPNIYIERQEAKEEIMTSVSGGYGMSSE